MVKVRAVRSKASAPIVAGAGERGRNRRNNLPAVAFSLLGCGASLLLVSYVWLFSLSTTLPPLVASSSTGAAIRGGAAAAGASKSSAVASAPNGRGNDPVIVAYAVSLTGCGSDPLTDGASVLRRSIHLNSIRNPTSSSKYDYKTYAIVHPSALPCSSQLSDVGYEVLVRDVPVPLGEIEGEFLKNNVAKNGCCGEKEFVKLHAYNLVDHPIAVHLDLDTLILKPLDELFDAMLESPNAGTSLPVMFDRPIPERVDAYFTRDYNMISRPPKPHPGVQGGFLVLRPSVDTYEAFRSIIRKGDFRPGSGWGGQNFGTYYGGMTFQGILPYYYDAVAAGTAVELNRCVYNQMCDNPRDKRTVNDVVSGNCKTGERDCEDCRSRPLEDVRTAHFTLCQKPWLCTPQNQGTIQQRLCRKLHREWFRVRADLEESWGRKKVGAGTYDVNQFYGFCKHAGKAGYIPIDVPKKIAGSNVGIK